MAEGEATTRGRLNHRSDARSSLLPPNYTISESKARERHRGVKAAKEIPRDKERRAMLRRRWFLATRMRERERERISGEITSEMQWVADEVDDDRCH